MTDNLKNLILRLYPDGNTDSWNEAALDNKERDLRLRSALHAAAAGCDLTWDSSAPQGKLAYDFHFTEKAHPDFEQWFQHMDNPAKIAWIKSNGAPYPVLCLRVSRAADYYYHFFNHWTPRGDTGYLDNDSKRQPDAAWVGRLAVITGHLEQAGFKHCTNVLAAETTPFVLDRDYDSIPDDDPRWDEDDFKPPLVPSTVHECLFGD